MEFQVIWIEIPVKDINRALAFYEKAFDLNGDGIVDDGIRKITNIRMVSGQAGFTLNQTDNFEPSDKGILVYIKIDDSIQTALKKVSDAGGTVMSEKEPMGSSGFYALVKDTEGNIFGIFSSE